MQLHVPLHRGRETGNHYYSLDVGPVHLVAYNGEAFYWPEYFDADYMVGLALFTPRYCAAKAHSIDDSQHGPCICI
jgi:hypothetical protein